MSFTVNSIGAIHAEENTFFIELKPEYKTALIGIEGFGYVQVLWWFDGCDNVASRSKLLERKPYKKGPELLGTFAMRSPERPNPIAISTAYVTYVDFDNGVLGLAWIDANDGTPVLDIKPYTPSADRVEHPIVPDWCAHWPKNVEESGDFDWGAEFNF
ncbi:MAG: SAM-dependent methyltransferase [Proteiniphilum sp.]|nr:SAM-dependent methyltransferase [Proteiniphilum sp.]